MNKETRQQLKEYYDGNVQFHERSRNFEQRQRLYFASGAGLKSLAPL